MLGEMTWHVLPVCDVWGEREYKRYPYALRYASRVGGAVIESSYAGQVSHSYYNLSHYAVVVFDARRSVMSRVVDMRLGNGVKYNCIEDCSYVLERYLGRSMAYWMDHAISGSLVMTLFDGL